MKKFILIVAFLLIQIELIAQCPTGFQGPTTVTVEICEGCSIQATWCCDILVTIFGNKPAIHFSDILIIGDCEFCLEWMTTPSGWGVPAIPWDMLIEAVLDSDTLCFYPALSIPPCEPAPPTEYNIIVTNGGCYTRIETMEGVRYTPCDTDVQAYCYEYYKICMEIVNGHMKMKVEGQNKQPAFNCVEQDCYPMCE
ncbi:MAG: hypothetical protein M9949_03970 [Candidatus Kapabacteria bacterium]|nr:hypothetical protein [Candidatus Kapabacteria bacterium]